MKLEKVGDMEYTVFVNQFIRNVTIRPNQKQERLQPLYCIQTEEIEL